LQYIPETSLNELIHSIRLRFNSESRKPAEDPSLAGCLKSYSEGYIPTVQAVQQACDVFSFDQDMRKFS
jgi:hypothetical protein